MIKLAGVEADLKILLERYPAGSVEREVLDRLSRSARVYEYSSMEELVFETELRGNIVNASLELYRGRLGFRTFQESRCNEAFWERRSDGGFVLRRGVKPSDGILDIFRNTRKYATECATAIVIVFYGAVLKSFSENLFNTAFTEIVLMNWMEMDELMGVATYRRITDYLPGDCRYFRNPDVNPLTPEWQGENAIDLGDGRYYGHGIGIGNKERIIAALNDNRIEGAEASAYLMDTATRPNFSNLYQYKQNAAPTVLPVLTSASPASQEPVTASAATGAAAEQPAAGATAAEGTGEAGQGDRYAVSLPAAGTAHLPLSPASPASPLQRPLPLMRHPFEDHPVFLHPHI